MKRSTAQAMSDPDLRGGSKGGQDGGVLCSQHLQELQLLGGVSGLGSLGQNLTGRQCAQQLLHPTTLLLLTRACPISLPVFTTCRSQLSKI